MLSMENKFLTTAMALGLLCAGGITTAAQAQDAQMNSGAGTQQIQQGQVNVTPAQLEEFAEAESSVRELHKELKQQAQSLKTEEEVQAFRKKANDKTIQTIENTGMSVEEYKQIATAIQSNPDLQKTFMTKYR